MTREMVSLPVRVGDLALGIRNRFDGGGECAEAHRAVGELLLESRRPDEARAAFERALTRATLPGAHLGLARVAAVRGDPDAAVRHLESELQIDPESSAAYLELGLIAERLLNDASRADEAFRRFREVGGDPGVLEARRRAGGAAPRGYLRARRRDRERADAARRGP